MTGADSCATIALAAATLLSACTGERKAPPPDVASAPKTAMGNPWRARGNEPFWSLEIAGDKLILLTDAGEKRTEATAPEPEVTSTHRRYSTTTSDGELQVTVFLRPCADDMSGMPYPETVEVVLAGQTLKGCGGETATVLQGEWVVQSINGKPLVEKSIVTLNFGTEGLLTGRASCNSYSGGYTLTGEGLTVPKVISTLMACAPELMRQEEAFLALLGDVQRFEIAGHGGLILHATEGRTLEARRTSS